MISDEMRELLSAYVDGELRDVDAARVEEVSKRDPELRREIDAYRILRRKLQEWDTAEHGALPWPTFPVRAVERARAMDAALAEPLRTRFLGPLAAAAAILVAAAAGYLLAGSQAPATPSDPRTATHVAVKPLGPAPELALPDSGLVPAPPQASTVARPRIDDHIQSRRAVELEEAMRREELVRAMPSEPERRTRTPLSAEITAMLEGSVARPASRDSLVVLARPRMLPGLPSLEPAPAGKRLAQDFSDGRIRERLLGTGHVLAPLGEVWVSRDGRTRLVAASDWIAPKEDMLVRVVWGDGNGPSRSGELLEAEETILGPKARRRLLSSRTGPDADFLAWLKDVYGVAPLPARFAEDAKDRERAMNKLLDALRADETATGFAVLDAKGNLLGVEMFHDRAAMLGFAPRLLRGYLLEAGEDGIRVTPPVGAGGLARVQGFLEAMPSRGLRVERQKLEDEAQGYSHAPEGLCRANLVGPSGQIMGHGLLIDDTPIHLTLFGE